MATMAYLDTSSTINTMILFRGKRPSTYSVCLRCSVKIRLGNLTNTTVTNINFSIEEVICPDDAETRCHDGTVGLIHHTILPHPGIATLCLMDLC